ncbi:MAG: secretin N-terminal domain-containing protein [Thermoanaerobaculales bacterium]|nr:secretin N-terminal domain-containing protein [Thermoanaerobaculales bacterium]
MFHWQTTNAPTRLAAAAGLVALLFLAGGCSTAEQTANEGDEAFAQQNWDAAVYYYLQALAEEPDNVEYKLNLTFARQKASAQHFQRGTMLRELGRLKASRDELQMAVQLDPTNQFAEQLLKRVSEEIEILGRPDGARELEEIKRAAREAKVKPPVLDPKSKDRITLNFPKPKPVKEIYQAMAKAYGFNVLFDPKLKDDQLTIELNDLTAEQSLEMVMQAAGHFYKVLDEHTIIVVDDTPQNRREYEDLVIKTFFLSNADVKDVDKLLRSLIEARRLSTNEQLNAITLRDTADKVAIAEKLISVNDKAKAEVLVDVELLLMSKRANSDIGASLSSYVFNLGLDTAAASGTDGQDGFLYLDQFKDISRGDWFVNVPNLVISLAKSSGNAEVLAQPQLRITEGEKASLHIGDRVPIPVTSFNTGYQGSPGTVTPITSFQYQDVGIKIDVEPRVHHNREVTLKLTVEVSNLGDEVSVGPNQTAVTIGTRNITSVIRLQSGESSLLAGLIRRDTGETETKTPLLSDIPLIGRLFTTKSKELRRNDLVLTLTPSIIRFPDIEEEDLAPMWVGTESQISYYGSRSPRIESGRAPQGPFDSRSSSRGRTGERPERSTTTPDPDSLPYNVARPGTPRRSAPNESAEQPQQGGVELVPGVNKSLVDTGDEEDPDEEALDIFNDSTVLVGLEPSVLSLAAGSETALQLVARGAPPEGYRLPVTVSFDPTRVAIDSVATVEGVRALYQDLEPDEGWIELELDVAGGGPKGGQSLAVLRVRALEPGPVPLVVTAGGVTRADGAVLSVAVGNGALFVTDEPQAGGK